MRTGGVPHDPWSGLRHPRSEDLLTGGGRDMFVASAGNDTITDFTGADTLNMQAFTAFASFADVQAALTQQGADTLLELGNGNSVLIRNKTVAQFTATCTTGRCTTPKPLTAPIRVARSSRTGTSLRIDLPRRNRVFDTPHGQRQGAPT